MAAHLGQNLVGGLRNCLLAALAGCAEHVSAMSWGFELIFATTQPPPSVILWLNSQRRLAEPMSLLLNRRDGN